MKGLRFYRSSITSQIKNGSHHFSHSEIEVNRSDFDYIFKPIYKLFSGKYLINEELPVLDTDFEYEVLRNYEEFIVQKNEHYLVTKTEILNTCGKNIPEFDGNNILISNTPPKAMSWDEFCNYHITNTTEIECCLHNWDGIYWEIFSLNEQYFDTLLAEHKTDKNLEIYWVDLTRDYPNPQRSQSELTHA